MMQKGRRGRSAIALALVIVLLMSGSIIILPSSEATISYDPSDKLILRVPMQDDIKALNPYAVNDVWSSNIIYQVYEGLVNKDWENQTTQPWIAVQWGVDKEQPQGCENCNISVEYKLGDWKDKWGGPISFHDGVEVTLDDVLFSYGMTLYNPRWVSSVDCIIWDQDWSNPPYGDPSFMKVNMAGKEAWLGVKILDEHTLQFRLSKTYVDFFDDTMSVTLFPKHIWKKHIDIQNGSGDYITWDMDYNVLTGKAPGMVGTSSFSFNYWLKGKQTSLLVNKRMFNWTRLPMVDEYGKIIQPERPAYDMSSAGWRHLPYINEVKYIIYHTIDRAVLAIDRGEIDILVDGSRVREPYGL